MEEDEPLELTLGEWKVLHGQNKQQATSNICQSGERKDNTTWSKGRKHHKKLEGDEGEEVNEGDHILDMLRRPRRRRRGGISCYERGGSRVPNDNINNPGNKTPQQSAPCVDDEEDFPSFVK